MKIRIETENMILLACDAHILKMALQSNQHLADYLNIHVPDKWTEFGTDYLEYSLNKLDSDENENGWLTYFPVHKKDNTLIGSGGYKGKPNNDGVVEIGYEIATKYRNKGLATEMTRALIENAFHFPHVKSIIAHTLSKENASVNILLKYGFKKTDEMLDPEDGLIWKWELIRNKFNQS